MLRGLFNRLYVGKNTKDLEKEDMASTPVQLFFEVLGVRARDLVKVSLLFFLFCIPALIWAYVNLQAIFNMGPDETYISYVLIFLLGLIPCLLLSGIGLCGLTGVCNRFARDMHTWIWTDFVAGIKENWKQALPISLIDGVALFICSYGFFFYDYMGQISGSLFFTFMQYLMVIILMTVLAMNIYYWPMMVTYAMPWKHLVQYSFTLVVLRLPYTLLFGAATLLPLALAIWGSLYWDAVVYVAVLVYALWGLGFIQYMLCSVAQTAFKKHIQDADAKPEEVHDEQKPAGKKNDEPQGVWSFLDEVEKGGDDTKK